MTAGLELRRDSDNALLLTYNLQNPNLVDKGNATSTATILNDGAGSTITVPNTGVIRALYCAPGISFHRIDNTRWWISGPVGTVATYYHFAASAPANTNIGMEIYADAVGSPLRFTSGSGMKPLRVDWVTVLATDGLPGKTSTKQLAVAEGLVGGFLQDDETNDPITGEPDGNHFIQRNYIYTIGFTGAGFGTAIVVGNHEVDAPLSDPGWVTHSAPQRATQYWLQCYFMFIDVTGY